MRYRCPYISKSQFHPRPSLAERLPPSVPGVPRSAPPSGFELDSLCDLANFGVSPALIIYFWSPARQRACNSAPREALKGLPLGIAFQRCRGRTCTRTSKDDCFRFRHLAGRRTYESQLARLTRSHVLEGGCEACCQQDTLRDQCGPRAADTREPRGRGASRREKLLCLRIISDNSQMTCLLSVLLSLLLVVVLLVVVVVV